MTSDEKKQVLDAVEAAEKEAIAKAEAMRLPAEAEAIVLKLAAQVRNAISQVDTTDLPQVGT
jgi:hypothetical protein